MKLNGTGLEKRSPRKMTKFQTRNGGQKTNLQLTRVKSETHKDFSTPYEFLVKSNGVSIRKLQLKKSKPAKFLNKTTGILPFSENNQAFCSIADIYFYFTTVSERKVPFSRRKSQRFAVLE